MDYKQHGPFEQQGNFTMGRQSYEDFGNFNYGAYGAARGISLPDLLVAAGGAQIKAGTSKLEWLKNSHGDDPLDQMWIKRGYNYAQTRMGADPTSAIRHFYRTR